MLVLVIFIFLFPWLSFGAILSEPLENSTEFHLEDDLPQLDGRIVGGSPANIYQFPHQISLQYSRQHICGGSIIHPSYILTAAHCVDGQQARKFSVRAGSSQTFGGGVISNVCSVRKHNSYNRYTQDNDIAILQLCTSLPSADGIRAISLPEQNELIYAGSVATVTGWGYTTEGAEEITRNLQQVQVPIVDSRVCKKLYRGTGFVSDNMVCAGETAEGGKDSCQGDSGGPLVSNGKLIGIVSWGYGCARPRYPGVYTKVAKYRNWINKQMTLQ